MSIKDFLVSPIKSIRVSILESQRRKAAEKITQAQNTGTPADVVDAKRKYSEALQNFEVASGEKPVNLL